MSTPSRYELSALCRDAFALLQGARQIVYKHGDKWSLEEDEVEHPLVNRLRAASVVALTEDRPKDEAEGMGVDELVDRLKTEIGVNDRLRNFLVELETLCHDTGMPQTVTGHEVLTWLRGRLTA